MHDSNLDCPCVSISFWVYLCVCVCEWVWVCSLALSIDSLLFIAYVRICLNLNHTLKLFLWNISFTFCNENTFISLNKYTYTCTQPHNLAHSPQFIFGNRISFQNIFFFFERKKIQAKWNWTSLLIINTCMYTLYASRITFTYTHSAQRNTSNW